MTKVKFYTRARETVMEMYDDGVPINEIKEKMNYKSCSAIYHFIDESNRMKYTSREPLTSKEEDLVILMYLTGFSIKEIRASVNCTRVTIYNVLDKNDIEKDRYDRHEKSNNA